jgi:DNA-binding IclR family transcriptional regulator
MIEGLERATRILDLFSSDFPVWTVSTVSRELNLPKTTAWEYMRAMADLGLVRRTDRTHYRLGWRAFQLGLRARMTSEISGRARAEMNELAERFNETVQLASRYRRDVVYLEKLAPRTGVRINATRVGERLPAHCTAEGKVLLAHLSPGEVRSLFGSEELDVLTERSVGTPEALEEELARVRERGYAFDREEALEGMCCIAAPVTNEHGDVAWALSMSFLEYRFENYAESYAVAVVEAAQRLSHPEILGLGRLPGVPPVRH